MHPVLALVLIVSALTPAASVPTQEPTTTPNSFTLRGIVVDAETGAAVRRVRVRAIGKATELAGSESDAEGRFTISGLGPGKYVVSVQKAGYLNGSYGQARPGGPGLSVAVPGHQGVLRIPISRGAAISGRVVDFSGEPVVNAQVQALRFAFASSGRQLVPAPSEGARAESDDQGTFRLFALAPGDYYIVARAPGAPIGGPAPDGGWPRQPVTTFYPNATDAGSAQPVRVTAGEERPPITVTLGAGRPARISGRLVTSTGEPVTTGFLTVSFADQFGIYTSTGGAAVRPDGSFQTSLLPPGRYRLMLSQGFIPTPEHSAVATVELDGADLTDVLIVTRMRASMRGRVLIDAREPTRLAARELVVQLAGAEDNTGPYATTATLKDDLSFEAQVPPGRYFVSGFARTGGWKVTDVSLANQSLAGQLVDVDANGVSGVELVLTNRTSEVRGTITGADGKPSGDVWVVLFSSDSRRWHVGSSRLSGVQADASGEFKFDAVLPSDDYLIIAVPGAMLEPEQWRDPATLQTLRPRAQRVIVEESSENIVNLQVVVP